GVGEEEWLNVLVTAHLGMTLHALRQHSPDNALFAVSSLGPRPEAVEPDDPPAPLLPRDLDRPLLWLAEALQAQDEARLEALWAAGQVSVLRRCVACFVQRYPQAPKSAEYQRRLRELVQRRRRRRGLLGTAAAACVVLGLVGFDS